MVENKDEDVRDMMPDGDEKSEFGKRAKVVFKKKICKFCSQNLQIDYKNLDSIKRFVTERGKILPRRITGTCAKHQRTLTKEVKRCRVLALLPFVKQ